MYLFLYLPICSNISIHDQIFILKSTIINLNDSVTPFNENKKLCVRK